MSILLSTKKQFRQSCNVLLHLLSCGNNRSIDATAIRIYENLIAFVEAHDILLEGDNHSKEHLFLLCQKLLQPSIAEALHDHEYRLVRGIIARASLITKKQHDSLRDSYVRLTMEPRPLYVGQIGCSLMQIPPDVLRYTIFTGWLSIRSIFTLSLVCVGLRRAVHAQGYRLCRNCHLIYTLSTNVPVKVGNKVVALCTYHPGNYIHFTWSCCRAEHTSRHLRACKASEIHKPIPHQRDYWKAIKHFRLLSSCFMFLLYLSKIYISALYK